MRLKLRHSYWEDSLKSTISYKAIHIKMAVFLFLVVGFTGGFFGFGGGWAVVPVLNLVMSIPLKVSQRLAFCSHLETRQLFGHISMRGH